MHLQIHQKANITSQVEKLNLNFSVLKAEADSLLSTYSSQYSSLSTQSKRSLPFTPAVAQQRLSEAEKLMAAAIKLKDPQSALLQANQSYQKLVSLHDSLQGALLSLQASAASSLGVAKVALSEVKSKGGVEDAADISQIEAEVGKAEGFLANALYSDSLVSSDKAVKAANVFLGKKSGGTDIRAVFIGALSLLFLAAAAYYFLGNEKKRKHEEKKEMPKAEAGQERKEGASKEAGA